MLNLAHIHPMLIHFPLALVPVGLAAQAVSQLRGEGLFGRGCLARSGLSLLLLAALGAIGAAVFGDLALDQALASGVPLAKLEGHEELGTLSAILLSVLVVVEAWFYRVQSSSRALSWGFLAAGMAVFSLLLVTALFGGNLVYELGVNVARAV